jgi:hypothetical protein
MPRMNGVEPALAIRAEERGRRRAPIIALTAGAIELLRGNSERSVRVPVLPRRLVGELYGFAGLQESVAHGVDVREVSPHLAIDVGRRQHTPSFVVTPRQRRTFHGPPRFTTHGQMVARHRR